MTKQIVLLGAVALFGAAAFASETTLLEELIAIDEWVSEKGIDELADVLVDFLRTLP